MPRRRTNRSGLRLRNVAMLALFLGIPIAWIALSRHHLAQGKQPAQKNLLDWVPAGALILADVNVRALRRTRLGQTLLGRGRRIAGLGDIASICGGDPLQTMQRLVVAVPQDERAGFGLFAEGPLDSGALLQCAREVARRQQSPINERGGEGGFRILENLFPGPTATELAVRSGGPLLLSSKGYVKQALATGSQGHASMAGEERHAALRKLVGPGMIQVTAVLSDAQRRSLRLQLGRGGDDSSPFLDIVGGGFSLSIAADAQLVGALRCIASAPCQGVAQLLNTYLADFAEGPFGRVLGLGAMLAGSTPVKAVGSSVQMRLRMPLNQARLLLKLLLARRRLTAPVSALRGDRAKSHTPDSPGPAVLPSSSAAIPTAPSSLASGAPRPSSSAK